MQPNIASLPLALQGAPPRALSASLALTDCPTQHLDLFLFGFTRIRATSRQGISNSGLDEFDSSLRSSTSVGVATRGLTRKKQSTKTRHLDSDKL